MKRFIQKHPRQLHTPKFVTIQCRCNSAGPYVCLARILHVILLLIQLKPEPLNGVQQCAPPIITKPLPSSPSPSHHHQTPPIITKPLPSSPSPSHHHQTPPIITKPLPSSPSLSHHHQAPPIITKPLPSSPSPSHHHQASPIITKPLPSSLTWLSDRK